MLIILNFYGCIVLRSVVFIVYGVKNDVILVGLIFDDKGAEWSKFSRKKGVETTISKL